MIRGFGLGFLFAPINQVAYASVSPREAQQASGLINLARQLGGSFGIAILGTYLNTRADMHRADLVRYVYAGNPQLESRLQGLIGNFQMHGYGPVEAKQAAYAMIDRSLTVQAQTSSYNDSFLMILVFFFITSPAIFLLRKSKAAAVPVDAH